MTRVLMILAIFAMSDPEAPDEAEPKATIITGAIAAQPTEAGFEIQTAKGKIAVAVSSDTSVTVHEAVPLEKVPPGTLLAVLGRRQEKVKVPGGGPSLPAQIVQINTVVAVEEFSPPRISDDQFKARLKWIFGVLASGGQHFTLDGTNMQIGKDRLVLAGKRADLESKPLAKGQHVRIEGIAADDKKQRRLEARSIVVLASQFPAKEYEIVFGDAAKN
ncbi:MAG: hypothetical protein L0Z55_12420 [Planctomycetes bacterium]|nr:hypothetical protein [Planctomycetota bacterium]